jgi:autotransporter family porin
MSSGFGPLVLDAPARGSAASAARFETLPPGAALPSGAECASRVRPADEGRPGNAAANRTRGAAPNADYPRVDGDFTGTTDEILQWVACKWGIDEDLVRGQAAKESWWRQDTRGDLNEDQDRCHPALRTDTGPCPESIGLLQVRYIYHSSAYANLDALRSTAYNADYAYAYWRECFEGRLTWLNDVERGATYQAGDAAGCLGVWYAGRWYTPGAVDYIRAVQDYVSGRVWQQPDFVGN